VGLQGKVVVVAGGGAGIGEACSRGFAAKGAQVVVVDYDEGAAVRTSEAIVAEGGTALPFVADVASEEGAAGMIAFAVERFGGLDVLHNNVFGMQAGLLEDITLEGWNKTLRLTLTSVFLGTKYAVPELAARGGGAIVNTASVAGLVSQEGLGPYSVAKAGVLALTRSTAVDYGREGIRANAVCPSTVETPALRSNLGDGRATSWLGGAPSGRRARPVRTGEDAAKVLAGKAAAHLTGRLLQPAEIAAAVVWLASDEASGLTGVTLPVDAGLTAQSPGPAVG
jgi:NAD(P)-dependent dehydrogenase (short-subunit alcohol dehydrogenase family)